MVVTGRDPDKVDRAANQLGESARGLAADADQSRAADEAVVLAVSVFGRLDALYHVAGGSGRSRGDGHLHEVSDEGVDYTLDVNLKSMIYSNRAALRQFLKQGQGGAILNMGSVLGFSPSPDFLLLTFTPRPNRRSSASRNRSPPTTPGMTSAPM